ncbi:four helix bundle protein, partial [Klebsiella sp. Kps]|uniref:four helix bundle protein n=1 Tax=Klebsiella sp. Kps TaxID=2758579 RepID=UPI0016461737
SNIAEGSGRETTRDLLNFLSMSRGSLRETQSLLIMSQRLHYITEGELEAAFGRSNDAIRLMGRLRASLSTRL